ncbi:MAG: hypothetical protein R3277_13195 [Brumimicrobium sp.]|nr:hypothetical protein [Brumimicrobium sp.]
MKKLLVILLTLCISVFTHAQSEKEIKTERKSEFRTDSKKHNRVFPSAETRESATNSQIDTSSTQISEQEYIRNKYKPEKIVPCDSELNPSLEVDKRALNQYSACDLNMMSPEKIASLNVFITESFILENGNKCGVSEDDINIYDYHSQRKQDERVRISLPDCEGYLILLSREEVKKLMTKN